MNWRFYLRTSGRKVAEAEGGEEEEEGEEGEKQEKEGIRKRQDGIITSRFVCLPMITN